jgi:hypothetical protein
MMQDLVRSELLQINGVTKMATETQTIRNEQILSPEQKALMAAELEQMRRRADYERFMGEIILGSANPGQAPSGPVVNPPVGPSPVNPPPSVNPPAGGNPTNPGLPSGVAGTVGSIGGLGSILPTQPSAPPMTGTGTDLSGIGNTLGNLLTPGVIGGIGGALVGGPAMIGAGSQAGNALGDLLQTQQPEVNRPDSTAGNSAQPDTPPPPAATPSEPGLAPSGPTPLTQGQQSAQSAYQHALNTLYTQANAANIGTTAAQHDMDPAWAANQNSGNYYSGLSAGAASRAIQFMKANGWVETMPGFSEEVSRLVQFFMGGRT